MTKGALEVPWGISCHIEYGILRENWPGAPVLFVHEFCATSRPRDTILNKVDLGYGRLGSEIRPTACRRADRGAHSEGCVAATIMMCYNRKEADGICRQIQKERTIMERVISVDIPEQWLKFSTGIRGR